MAEVSSTAAPRLHAACRHGRVACCCQGSLRDVGGLRYLSDALNAVEKAMVPAGFCSHIYTIITYSLIYSVTSAPMHASNTTSTSKTQSSSISARSAIAKMSMSADFLGGVINSYNTVGAGVKYAATSAVTPKASAPKPHGSVQPDQVAVRAKAESSAIKSALIEDGLPSLKKTVTRVTQADGSVRRSFGNANARCKVLFFAGAGRSSGRWTRWWLHTHPGGWGED